MACRRPRVVKDSLRMRITLKMSGFDCEQSSKTAESIVRVAESRKSYEQEFPGWYSQNGGITKYSKSRKTTPEEMREQ